MDSQASKSKAKSSGTKVKSSYVLRSGKCVGELEDLQKRVHFKEEAEYYVEPREELVGTMTVDTSVKVWPLQQLVKLEELPHASPLRFGVAVNVTKLLKEDLTDVFTLIYKEEVDREIEYRESHVRAALLLKFRQNNNALAQKLDNICGVINTFLSSNDNCYILEFKCKLLQSLKLLLQLLYPRTCLFPKATAHLVGFLFGMDYLVILHSVPALFRLWLEAPHTIMWNWSLYGMSAVNVARLATDAKLIDMNMEIDRQLGNKLEGPHAGVRQGALRAFQCYTESREAFKMHHEAANNISSILSHSD